MRDGKGKYINEKEGVEYEGYWKNGLRHGEGTLKYNNGSVYIGEWEEGKKCGQGKMTYASKNYYEGEWKNNKRNGEGVMFWESTSQRYSGTWLDGFQSGFGTHIWLDPRGENKLLRNKYVGYWKGGLRHGQGTFYYSNGSKYEGEWENNLKHGLGIFTFDDGSTYEGPFKQDRMVNKTLEGVATIPQEQETGKGKGKGKGKEKKTKFIAEDKTKFEVQKNMFIKLIDITDLVELEPVRPDLVKLDTENTLLRSLIDLKKRYKYYSRKLEVVKRDDSFALTLRQVWRLIRDSHLFGSDPSIIMTSIAEFNRLFAKGSKNHFALLGEGDKDKF